METFEVHYWDTNGDPKVACVEGEYGHDAAESIEDMGRLGFIIGVHEQGDVVVASFVEPESAPAAPVEDNDEDDGDEPESEEPAEGE